MSRGAIAFALLSCACLIGCGQTENETSPCGSANAEVVRVIDGDTVVLTNDVTIRYWFVNTPELSGESGPECFAEEAREANRRMVEGRRVRLTYPPIEEGCYDRYDRVLALVEVDGVVVNKVLVEQGYARVESFGDDDPILGELEYLEDQAKENRSGLWGECQ